MSPAGASQSAGGEPGQRPRRQVTWVGHATVLIETRGVGLLTDPVLGWRVAHLRRQIAPAWEPTPVDGVLVSHVHHDHLDRPSLRAVASTSTRALVPAGAAPLVRGLGFGAIDEVRSGDVTRIRDLDIRAVPAWHPARRYPWTPELPSLGFLIDRIWFAGDTDLDPGMEALQGAVELALLPIWGWGPSLGPGHMDPEGAARALALVCPRVAVPIHWGTFLPIGHGRRHARLLRDPPVAFAEHAGRLAPGTEVVTLRPGERLAL